MERKRREQVLWARVGEDKEAGSVFGVSPVLKGQRRKTGWLARFRSSYPEVGTDKVIAHESSHALADGPGGRNPGRFMLDLKPVEPDTAGEDKEGDTIIVAPTFSYCLEGGHGRKTRRPVIEGNDWELNGRSPRRLLKIAAAPRRGGGSLGDSDRQKERLLQRTISRRRKNRKGQRRK